MQQYNILDKTYDKVWLDLDKIANDFKDFVDVIVCIGDNSLGKTYSIENRFIKLMLSGKKVAWIRNTDKEIWTCINGWRAVFSDKERCMKYFGRNDLQDIFYVDRLGIYIKTGKKIRTDKTLMCPFIYASSGDSSIPQIEKIVEYAWDELLGGNEKRRFTMKSAKNFIIKMQNRLTRDFVSIKPILFLLANPHSPESDVYSDLGIDFDWGKLYREEDIIELNEERGQLLLIFPTGKTWDNPRLLEQSNRIKRMFGSEEGAYKFPKPELKRIYPKTPTTFEPMFNFLFGKESDLMDNWWTIGTCNHPDTNEEGWVYITTFERRYENLDCYCIDADLQKEGVYFIDEDEKIYNLFKILREKKLFGDKIIYKKLFIKQEIVSKLILLLEDIRFKLANED